MAKVRGHIPRSMDQREIEAAFQALYNLLGREDIGLPNTTAFTRELLEKSNAPQARALLDAVGGRSGLTENVLPRADASGDAVDSSISDDGSLVRVDNAIELLKLYTSYVTTGSEVEGTVYWDQNDKTMAIVSDVAGTVLQVGREQLIRVVNKTGATLNNGDVVYINGAHGNRPTVALADADLYSSHYTIGVVTSEGGIANNSNGYINIRGLARSIDTTGWTAGDELFLSQTAGEIVNVKPSYPAHAISIGYALDSTVNGSILVSINEQVNKENVRGISSFIQTLLDDTTQDDARQTLGAQLLNNGLEDAIDITWTDATRTLAITTTDFRVNVHGVQYSITGGDSLVVPDLDGFHFVYYDNTGTLVTSQTPWEISTTAPIFLVYWNSAEAKGLPLNERHTATMDELTHRNLHLSRGSQYISGGAIADYTLDVRSDAAISYSLTEAVMFDEDLPSTLVAVPDAGPYFLLQREGASGIWNWSTTSVLPVHTAGGGNIAWNEDTGVTWQLTEITTNNTRVNYYVIGVPSIDDDKCFAIFPGQSTFASLADAENETFADLSGIDALLQELVPMYRITYKFSTAVSGGTTGASIEAVQDIRGESTRRVSVSSVADHQTLTNRDATAAHPASAITPDTSNFDGILTPTEDTLQKVLDALDDRAGNNIDNVVVGAGTGILLREDDKTILYWDK